MITCRPRERCTRQRDSSRPAPRSLLGRPRSPARSISSRISIASRRRRAVERPVVLRRELAGAQVALGVADLAVLGLLAGLELGQPLGAAAPLALAAGPQERRADAPRPRPRAITITARTSRTSTPASLRLARARGPSRAA